ncbi:MAG: PEP-CTERM sorting domain-containing protein [Kiritimatiellae bacterium]|nr:PEP-CTERM sorting domain-containing protein [Kiritimatiellia bacterium]
MKKFMTFAAFAAFAVGTQAATISWGLGGDVYLVDSDSGNYLGDAVLASASGAPTVTDGSYLALVYVGQNKDSFGLSDVSTVVATLSYDTAPYDGGCDYEPFSTDTAISPDTYTSGASFGIVWFDAQRNTFDFVYSGDDGSSFNQTVTLSETSAQGQGALFPAGDYSQSYSGILAVKQVPEPGIACMALLGLGMLIKRRRA